MPVRLLCLLVFFSFAEGALQAQESPRTQLEEMQSTIPEQETQAPLEAAPAKKPAPEIEVHRLFGIFPTYTVSNSKSPTALTVRMKFRLFAKAQTDPFTYVGVAFDAGIGQASDSLSGYGQGAAGYGKRVGAGAADVAAGGFFGTFLFPSLFRQDPRYFRQGSGPFKDRLAHALIRPFVTRTDSGVRALNWSGMLGNIAASGLSNAYYPRSDRGAGETFSRFGISIPFSMLDKVLEEFGPDIERKLRGKK